MDSREWERKFDEQFEKDEKMVKGFFVIVLLVMVAVLGVGIWGFIEFIQWLTAR